jgi:hypothetical protein
MGGNTAGTVILAAAITAAACTPDIRNDAAPAVVEAEFDPAAEPSPRIPSPTDLAYDGEAGRLSIGVEEGDSDLQKALAGFLSTLDGWPASMPATASFLGPVDPATITPSTVRVFDITDIASPVPVEGALRILEGEGAGLRVHPGIRPTWEPGRRYVVAVLGGEEGVKGAAGETVTASPAFWFFRAENTLVACEAPETLEGCESVTALLGDEEAADLEEVRREAAEVFDALEAAGIPRDEIAVAWSFRTSSRTVVPFDPSVDDVHFPNDYYRSEDEARLDLRLPEGSTPEAEAVLARLNGLDGFSLTAAGRLRFVGPLDGSPANLTPSSLLYLNADEEGDLPLVERRWDAERGEVSLVPYRALHPGTRYAVVATDYLTDESGQEIIPSHIWALLRSPFPAVDGEGRSLLSGISDEDARDLEEARLDYEEFFETLAGKIALPRESMQVGVVFTTRTVLEPTLRLRQIPYEANVPTVASAPGGVRDPAGAVPEGYPRDHLIGVVMGVIPGLGVLDAASREIDEGAPGAVELPYILTLPIAPPEGRTSPPVVIFQHDLDGSRGDLFAVADALAAEGLAAIAIDLVGHGGRGVCLADDDCDAGACAAGRCAGGSLEVGPGGLPLNARGVLLPASNPFAVGGGMLQQAVDLATLARALKAPDGPGSTAGVDIDTADISFFGLGFGAMAGTIFMAVDPSVHVAVLTGAGGNLAQIMDLSSQLGGAIDAWLGGQLGLEAGTEAWLLLHHGWSMAADPGDAAVYAHHLVEAPLPDPDGPGSMEPRALLVQVPTADAVIPFESMRFFFLSVGPELYPEMFEGSGNGFILDPADAAGEFAREQAAVFIASGGETVLEAAGGGR